MTTKPFMTRALLVSARGLLLNRAQAQDYENRSNLQDGLSGIKKPA